MPENKQKKPSPKKVTVVLPKESEVLKQYNNY